MAQLIMNQNIMVSIILLFNMITILASTVFLVLFLHFIQKQNVFLQGWKYIRRLKSVFVNYHRIHDKLTEILEKRQGSIRVKNKFVNLFITCDPKNVCHITSSNFLTYPKGIDWRKRFDIFGDALFNSDFEEWNYHRTVTGGFLSHQKFNEVMKKISHDIINKRLTQFLRHVSREGHKVDLKDVFQRLMFDIVCIVAAGMESNSLCVGVQKPLFFEAIDNACEVIFSRCFIPEKIWKLQNWLGIGKEKRMKQAWETLDQIFQEYVCSSKERLSKLQSKEDTGFSILDLYMMEFEIGGSKPSTYNVMRDNVLGFMFAMGDTTSTTLSWFFWLLSEHPLVEKKIIDELDKVVSVVKASKEYTTDELSKMVYLHATLCETLRLFPPVPFNMRTATKNDTLPSGHRVDQKTIVVLSTYSMGRMSFVWGNDCHKFKPERWIGDDGNIKYEPSYKFFSFNAGPRNCPGKTHAFTLMKTIIATIMQNFHVKYVDNGCVTYKPSIILRMKSGLMARLSCRTN